MPGNFQDRSGRPAADVKGAVGSQGAAASPPPSNSPNPPMPASSPVNAPVNAPPALARLQTQPPAAAPPLASPLASAQSPPVPRNVSFARDSTESTAYREHNPPAVSRRQEAARREMSPSEPRPTFQVGAGSQSSLVSQQPQSQYPQGQHAQGQHTQGQHAQTGAHFTQQPHSRSGTPTSIISPTISPSVGHNVGSNVGSNAGSNVGSNAGSNAGPNAGHSDMPPSIMRGRGASYSGDAERPEVQAAHGSQMGSTQIGSTQIQPATQGRSASRATSLSTPSTTPHASHTSLTAPHTTAPHTSPHTDDSDQKSEEVHILVAVTGSVATIKSPQIVHKSKQIYRRRAAINVVVTKASTIFFEREDSPKDVKVWYDSDEWRSREASVSGHAGASVAVPGSNTAASSATSDQQSHIRSRRWADISLVAPCSANTLAKSTYGICDNSSTSIFRVWNPEVPISLAPAMNTHMYTNPVTKRHFNIIKESFPFVEISRPVEKVLVCGDIGMGGMREWNDIVQVLVKRVGVSLESDTDEDDDAD